MTKTRQEIFDAAYIGLSSQDWQQASEPRAGAAFCRYRKGNLKCAIGWNLPDDKYDPGMDHDGDPRFHFYQILDRCDISREDEGWASDLQKCHDGPDHLDPVAMKAQFDNFAVKLGLTIPVLP